MTTRDDVEQTIRAWDRHELEQGRAAIIDFDFRPTTAEPPLPQDRLTTYQRLSELLPDADEPAVAQRINADLAYLRALMGERMPLNEYVQATQGCPAIGWPSDYVAAKGDIARAHLDALGVGWGENTVNDLAQIEGPIDATQAPDAIRDAATEYEAAVRHATGSDAEFDLIIENADVDAYWSYWLDGAGQKVRLRLNTRSSNYTKVQARQFALHEVLGHGLQSASIAARCAVEEVPWVRLLSVHGPQQVLL